MYIDMLPKELWGIMLQELTIVMKSELKDKQKRERIAKRAKEKAQAERDVTDKELRRKYRKVK